MKNQLFATTVATLVTPAILSSTLLLTTQNAMAESVNVTDEGGLQLSITANRRPQSIDKTLASVTVITRKDIENSQATRLEDVLKRVPGITVKSSGGGSGKQTSIFMRGTNSNHVLVLIDGVEVGSAPLDSVSFEHYPLEQVERIEVVRGPRSSLYGSRAIGGVINIITSTGQTGSSQSYKVGYGSNDSQSISVNVSNRQNNNWFRFSAGANKTKGIDVLVGSEPDRDGYKRYSIGLNIGHEFDNGMVAKAGILDIQGNTQYDGYFKESDFNQRVINGSLSGKITKNTRLMAKLGSSFDDLESINAGGSSVYTTRKVVSSIIADSKINKNIDLTYGAEVTKSKVSGTSSYTKNSRRNEAAFLSLQGTKGNTSVEASLRRDKNKQFGSHSTGGVSVGYLLKNGYKVSGSYATAFKAPSYYDLYDSFSGNSNLLPESSETFEVGLNKEYGKGSWGIRLFQTKINDLITYNYNPITFSTTISNTDKVLLKGLEGEFSTKISQWDLSANLTLLDPKNKSGINEGKALHYRSKKVGTLDLTRSFGKLKIGSSLHGESSKFTNPANTTKLAGFATVDLRADYQLSKNLKIGAKVGNILNKKYQINSGYNQDGINSFLTISYSPK